MRNSLSLMALPSRGNEKIGGTGYCVTYDTDSQSRNVLASPLGEEGHEVAKGWTVVRMIMILDVDVTAERRHYKTHRPLKGKRLTTFCASLALLHPLLSLTHWIFRSLMLPYKFSSHSAKCVRCAPRGRYHHPRPEGPSPPPERSEHNPTTQPAAEPRPLFYKNCGVSRHHHPLNLLNPRGAAPSTLMCAFCIECASQPKLALSLPIKGPSYCRLTVRRRVQRRSALFPLASLWYNGMV